MSNCKKCGAPIYEGKYCSRCQSQKRRKVGTTIKWIGGVVGGVIGSVIITALTGKSSGKNDKS